jgi:mevalonate kinase
MYGVLDGAPGLVLSHGPRLELHAEPGPDGRIELHAPEIQAAACSWAVGSAPGAGHPAGPGGPLRYLGALFAHRPNIPWGGLSIRTRSAIPPGLGSSSALVVTALAARRRLEGLALDLPGLVQEALVFVRRLQGGGSGADLAAAAMGGALAYRLSDSAEPRWEALPDRLPGDLHLSVWRRGSKTDTSAAIARWQAGHGKELVREIGDCAEAGIDAWRRDDGDALCTAVDRAQQLQIRIGAVHPSDAEWMAALRRVPGVVALVSTGSGGGEAVAVWWRGQDPSARAATLVDDLQTLGGRAMDQGLEME